MCEQNYELHEKNCFKLPFGCSGGFCNNDRISVVRNLSRDKKELELRLMIKQATGATWSPFYARPRQGNLAAWVSN